MKEDKLTLSAKEALRKYVLSLLILPSAILTTVGFALGYAVNDWAKGQAYVAAYEKSADKMLDMAINAGRAMDDAEEAQKEITKVVEYTVQAQSQVEDAHTKANEALQKINAVDVFDSADKQVDKIADAVLAKTNIEERVITKFDTRLKKIEITNSKLRKSETGKVVKVDGGGPWGSWKKVSYCPTNHYVCGLQQRVEKKQGSDDDTALNAVNMVCCVF